MSITSLHFSKTRSNRGGILFSLLIGLLVVFLLSGTPLAQQKIDEEYTAKIREFTIEPFSTKYVDYLPYSDTVPTPLDVLGHIAGAADVLSYSHEIFRYMRALADASPRVEVSTMGMTEEGREMILVVISDEEHLKNIDRYKQINAKLADPRTISDSEAELLIEEALPIYWVTAGLHSPETGSPEMVMELAYRLAVDESDFIKDIRENAIVMITPVLEPDGRDKVVDLAMAPRKDPNAPRMGTRPLYWGAYVAHDNNRDGLSLTLKLYQHCVKTYLEYHPQVKHDLHESANHLYVSTGTGPYNPFFDPIVINEWQTIAYQEVTEMTKEGVPGVWTHGFYDGWTPNYTFMIGNLHNAIGRFYEVQGAGDGSTRELNSRPSRAWYRPNPPLTYTMWSIRSNNNLSQSGCLIAINYVATHKEKFMENFYMKSKRSVDKATTEGPAAYVFPAEDPRKGQQARLLKLFQMQGVEVHKTNSSFTVEGQTFGAGSYVLRLDQPYSRIADMFLDKQYFNPNDPRPYDDVGWTLGPLYNAKTVRIEDTTILSVPMTLIKDEIKPEGGVKILTGGDNQIRFSLSDNRVEYVVLASGDGQPVIIDYSLVFNGYASPAYLINYNADNIFTTFRFKKSALKIHAAEESFTVAGKEFNPGSFIIMSSENPVDLEQQLDEAGFEYGFIAYGVNQVPDVPMHEVEVPRVALVHNWSSTQTEGWIRIALDEYEIQYDYIGLQDIRDNTRLRSTYDVIMLGPMGITQALNGTGGDTPRPYKKTDLTPNIGRQASTDDMRGGIEFEGVINLRNFIEEGGLFITITSASEFPIHFYFAQGLTIKETPNLWAQGGVYKTILEDSASPIAYGFGEELGVYFSSSPVFSGGRAVGGTVSTTQRPSGRGGIGDQDIYQGRPKTQGQPPGGAGQQAQARQRAEMQQQQVQIPTFERGRGFGERGAAGAGYRTIFRFNPNTQDLLISGGILSGEELAGAPAVVTAKMGEGHTLMFSINPFWRGETQGSYALVFNAMLHYNDLDAGRR